MGQPAFFAYLISTLLLDEEGKERNTIAMRIQELGHVVLYVSSLDRSADFYRDVLGFPQIFRKEGLAAFSSGRTHHELLLIEVGGAS